VRESAAAARKAIFDPSGDHDGSVSSQVLTSAAQPRPIRVNQVDVEVPVAIARERDPLASGDHAGFSSQAAPLVILLRAPLARSLRCRSPVPSRRSGNRKRLPFGDQLGSTSMPGPPEEDALARPEADHGDPDGAAALAAERDHGPRRGGAGDAAATATSAAVPDTTARPSPLGAISKSPQPSAKVL
jgi:hypothetical protein